MEKIRAHVPAIKELNRLEKALLSICAALLVAILVITCISINIRSNMQREYSNVRNQLGQALYNNMSMLSQTFDMASVPNADIKNAVIPQMKNYFIASATLNEQITNLYGQRYQVMSESDINTLRAAFSAYDAAFRSDGPTDLVHADMQICMDRVKELLNSRYNEGMLRAAR